MSILCHEGESFTCHEVMVKVKNFKSGTNAGIVIDGESIFYIQAINVFPHKILKRLIKYLMLELTAHRVSWKE